MSRREACLLAMAIPLESALVARVGGQAKSLDGTATGNEFIVRNLTQHVDPLMGSDPGPGKVSIGPSVPFGSIMVQPVTAPNSANTGYRRDAEISGFTNVNCESVYKYVNLLVSPQVGLTCYDPGNGYPTDHDSGKASEVVEAGYYSVNLTRYGLKAEVTAAHHTALYRFTYPAADDACILIDPSHNLNIQNGNGHGDPLVTSVRYDPRTGMVTGFFDVIGGWWLSSNIRVYFAAAISKPATEYGISKSDGSSYPAAIANAGQGFGYYFKFPTSADEPVHLKLATSFSSVAHAENFLRSEVPAWDFDGLKRANQNAWDRLLSTILIDDDKASSDDLKIFYTCLYRVFQNPKNKTGDCPWNYPGPYYDDFICVWDQFRTQFPLLALVKPSVASGIIQSFCEVYKHLGYAPDALIGGQIDLRQGGDDVDIIIADACVKGVPGINWTDAYQLLKGHATTCAKGRTPEYKDHERGWVPYGTIPHVIRYASWTTASKTLEFAYNDFCLSAVAQRLGYKDDAARFYGRSRQWMNLWNTTISSDNYRGFIQPKKIDGNWVYENPAEATESFDEGSSWIYSYFVPHQQAKLIELMGGNQTFTSRLEHFMKKYVQMDNEPSFLTPYGFVYALRPDLASFYVRAATGGYTTVAYPGEEDSGAMSSWYVFAQLGLFPVAGQDVYLINGPRFQRVVVQLENGKRIVINGSGASANNKYVQSAALRGESLDQAWLRHSDIKNGATLDFKMGSSPSAWGQAGNPPPSLS